MRISRLALGLIVAVWGAGNLWAIDLPASPPACQAGAETSVPAGELPPEPMFLIDTNVYCCNPPTFNCDLVPRTTCVDAGGSWFNNLGRCLLVC